MSSMKRFMLVLTLGSLAAFTPAAWAAPGEERAVNQFSSQEVGGICAASNLAKMPDPVFAVGCTCVPGGSVNCSGVGATCTQATNNFQNDCDSEADVSCSLDGVCSVTITLQNPCQWTGTQYEVTGRAHVRCRACP